MLVFASGEIVGTVGGGEFEYRVIAEAISAIESKAPRRYAVHLTRDLGMCCGGAMEAFIEPLQNQDRLVIYGAGHVGVATAGLAHTLGFALEIVDDRDDLLTAERFPPGAEFHLKDPRRALQDVAWGVGSYHLIVTHNHQLDQDLLEAILPRPLSWLGMIGSRAKVAKFFIRLQAAGVDPELFKKVCAPVGLDIGAETPEEIAVSIAAELVRVRRRCQRTPTPLSDNPIEARGGDGRARPPGLED
jgi:xanthine dehydrogenase accessory factor